MINAPEQFDVVIAGGGPAGSTAAAVLAAGGRKVLVLEKEQFPRYHVGESLLPFCYFPLQRIGMIEAMKASRFPKKHAVQFVTTEGKLSAPFYFFKHMDHEASTTWQVLRSEFDQMLLENALKHNVASREHPLEVDIVATPGVGLVFTNKIRHRTSVRSTGIGLKNIVSRYRFVSDREPIIKETSEIFSVTLPLLEPEAG